MKNKQAKTFRMYMCDDLVAMGNGYLNRCFDDIVVPLACIIGGVDGKLLEKPVRVYKSKDYDFCVMAGGDEIVDFLAEIINEDVYGDPVIPVTLNYILFCPDLLSAYAAVQWPSIPSAEKSLYKICKTWLTTPYSMNIEGVRPLPQSLTALQGPIN